MRRLLLAPVAIALLVAGAACGGSAATPPPAGPPTTEPAAAGSTSTPPAAQTASQGSGQTGQSGQSTQNAWPTPEDCIAYNPNNLVKHYEAGIHAVLDGNTVVAQASGGPTENWGAKLLALAQRYRSHCFLGRTNTRPEKNAYIFDYWRNPSGLTPTIPDTDEDCSPYNRNNLTVEDMGGGQGWRVKDHDHPLHLFNNASDANNGKVVLSKYGQACSLGNNDGDDPQLISYHL